MQRVKDGIGRGLRKTLHPQETVRSDLADDTTRFIDRRNQQAMRRAAPKTDPKIAEVVGLRRETPKLTPNLFHKRLLIP